MKTVKFNKTFSYEELDLISAKVVYLYLFKGYSLIEIETILLSNSENIKGWFSKIILNYYGIDTDVKSRNKGVFSDYSLQFVVDEWSDSAIIEKRNIVDLIQLLLK